MKNVWVYLFILLGAGIALWKKDEIAEIPDILMGKLTRSKFIEIFAPVAKSSTVGTGLFPSVVLAQAILESGNGNSSLTINAKNFFGIKADKSWIGDFVIKPTTEYVNGVATTIQARFRSYGTYLQSFIDHADFLIDNPRYKKAGVFSSTTPEQQAQALQNAGYATDPDYAKKLVALINANNLKQYDKG